MKHPPVHSRPPAPRPREPLREKSGTDRVLGRDSPRAEKEFTLAETESSELAIPPPKDPHLSAEDRDQRDAAQQGTQGRADEIEDIRRLGATLLKLGDLILLGCWNLRLPLDPGLLPDCVLQLRCQPGQVAVHFETGDWASRTILQTSLQRLEALLAARLPGYDVVISVG